MAPDKPAQKPAQKPQNRPPASPETHRANALKSLQRSMDRACALIHDSRAGYANRARRAAKTGIPRATVDAGIAEIEAALNDMKQVVNVAYNGGAAATASRATLKA